MSILVFISVMFAALLHAGWNALIKNGVDKQAGMLLLTLGHAFIGLCFIPFFPVPTGQVWLWLLASGIIHTFYQLFFGICLRARGFESGISNCQGSCANAGFGCQPTIRAR